MDERLISLNRLVADYQALHPSKGICGVSPELTTPAWWWWRAIRVTRARRHWATPMSLTRRTARRRSCGGSSTGPGSRTTPWSASTPCPTGCRAGSRATRPGLRGRVPRARPGPPVGCAGRGPCRGRGLQRLPACRSYGNPDAAPGAGTQQLLPASVALHRPPGDVRRVRAANPDDPGGRLTPSGRGNRPCNTIQGSAGTGTDCRQRPPGGAGRGSGGTGTVTPATGVLTVAPPPPGPAVTVARRGRRAHVGAGRSGGGVGRDAGRDRPGGRVDRSLAGGHVHGGAGRDRPRVDPGGDPPLRCVGGGAWTEADPTDALADGVLACDAPPEGPPTEELAAAPAAVEPVAGAVPPPPALDRAAPARCAWGRRARPGGIHRRASRAGPPGAERGGPDDGAREAAGAEVCRRARRALSP